MLVVDKTAKSSHCILVNDTYNFFDIAHVFINKIVRIHGFINKIISDRASVFTREFWMGLQVAL